MTDSDEFYDLGQIAWLWMGSGLHATWTTRLMMRNTLPPVKLGQYAIISNGQVPVAYASWAFFSPDAERRYVMDPTMIDMADWKSGDRMWVIDLISPYSTKYTIQLVRKLRTLFPGYHARALRVSPDHDTAQVHTYRGNNPPNNWHQKADAEVLSNFLGKGVYPSK